MCTFGTFNTDMANKIIKIMFNKYFKMPHWHFPNFNKIKIISILKIKIKILDFLCVFVHFRGNQKQKYKNYLVSITTRSIDQFIFGKNTILVPIFWGYSQFGPYILVIVNLILTVNSLMENAYVANNLHSWHI